MSKKKTFFRYINRGPVSEALSMAQFYSKNLSNYIAVPLSTV